MTPAASVGIAGSASDDFTRAQRAVWASLPMSLTVDNDAPRLVAVDGRRADWLDVVAGAVRSDVAGVLVVRPSAGPAAADIRALAESAAAASATVVVQTAWAAHPTVAGIERVASQRLRDAALIDSLAIVEDGDARAWDDVLLDHLALLRAVSRPLTMPRFSAENAHGYTLDGAHGSCSVALSAVRSSAARPCARLTIYAASGEAHLSVSDDGTAAPATAWFVDADGKVVQPSWYESAARATWRRLRDASAAKELVPDLLALADDLDLVAGVAALRAG